MNKLSYPLKPNFKIGELNVFFLPFYIDWHQIDNGLQILEYPNMAVYPLFKSIKNMLGHMLSKLCPIEQFLYTEIFGCTWEKNQLLNIV